VFGSLVRDVVDFHDDLVRNVKSFGPGRSPFDDLSTDAEDLAVAVAAERHGQLPSPAPLITRPFDYGAVVTYPFVPANWHSTRFSDGLAYGVWYGSLDLRTTVYETVHHWYRFVTDSFPDVDRDIVGERRAFRVRCDAILIDLRGKERRERRLVDRNDYTFTQGLGRYLREQRQSGLVVGSARCNGHNAALFRPEVLSGVRDLCALRYIMNPRQDKVRVERVKGRRWMEVVPSRLR
jgi:RES domain